MGITHALNSFTGAPCKGTAKPSCPHRQKNSPHPILWGQECLIYLKEAHHWKLGKGVALLFDLWLGLKKMGCQNARALKMQTAAATGAKMLKFTC